MKDDVVEKQQEKKNFLNKVQQRVKSELKQPSFWVGSVMLIFGLVSTLVATKKIANVKRENAALKKENERLGKQVNEAWYQAGKLQQQLINNQNK